MYTPFERVIHDLEFDSFAHCASLISFELDSFAHCASLISFELDSLAHCALLISFELDIFALVLHLDLLEHGGGFVLKKLFISHASLGLF